MGQISKASKKKGKAAPKADTPEPALNDDDNLGSDGEPVIRIKTKKEKEREKKEREKEKKKQQAALAKKDNPTPAPVQEEKKVEKKPEPTAAADEDDDDEDEDAGAGSKSKNKKKKKKAAPKEEVKPKKKGPAGLGALKVLLFFELRRFPQSASGMETDCLQTILLNISISIGFAREAKG